MNSIAAILRQLFEAYPNNRATEGTVAMYVKLLRDIPVEELQVVTDQAISECTFLPTVAELRQRWYRLTQPQHQLTADAAWGMVTAEIRRVGAWGSPTFDSPIVARIVANMGWRDLCASENGMADRAHFMRMFEQAQERDLANRRLLPQSVNLLEAKGGTVEHVGNVIKRLMGGPK
jgi:hypothetical protein